MNGGVPWRSTRSFSHALKNGGAESSGGRATTDHCHEIFKIKFKLLIQIKTFSLQEANAFASQFI